MKKNKKEKLIYGIIGLCRFGYALAMEIAESHAELIVLYRDEEKVRMLREVTENAYVVHNLEKKTLLDTGIQNCDVAIVCIGEHIDTSILVTLNLVGIGIKHVISKATSTEHGEILQKLGAEVVYPERDMAIRLANRLETEKILDFVQLSEKINISKMIVPSTLVNKSVIDVDLRGNYGVNIIAIENNGNVLENVGPDYIFKAKDILYLSGEKQGLMKLTEQ